MTYTFTKQDFDVFKIAGLPSRMAAIKEDVQPKLYALGDYFCDFLNTHTGETYYAHVAKHLRRTVNPPDDTWVAFSINKRGYKMVPHFQIGLFKDYAFALYGVIYEAPEKAQIAANWNEKTAEILKLPKDFIMKTDHMKENYIKISDLDEESLTAAIKRLQNVKKGDLLFGKVYYPGDDALKSDDAFLKEIENVFLKLMLLA